MTPRSTAVLELFEQINRIPRCSKHEREIGRWLLAWAQERGLAADQDRAGNVLIRVPATGGLESAPVVVLQGHMDMVCEKTPDSTHNFDTDPIPLVTEGEWLHAEDTTLGADNGVAIALALALAESDSPHPALEILITVDEETGLTGAQSLESGWLQGTQLLNIDSEDEGVFTVGCAGGRDTIFSLPVEREEVPPGLVARELRVGGLQGGHSGMDIHLGRANANQLLVRVLSRLREHGVRLASLTGGNAHNAIPRDSSAIIAIPEREAEAVSKAVSASRETFRVEYGDTEPALDVTLRTGAEPTHLFEEASAARLLDFLSAMPHGVLRMSSDVPGLVETSTNFATIRTKNDEVTVKTSQRSSFRSRIDELSERLEALGRLVGATVSNESSYPPWEPHMESELLGRAVEAYEAALGREPTVEVVHAGLECGVIGSKYPQMQMISFGPTIQNPHSPDERLHLPSLEKTVRFLEALLSSYADA
ncbi:MAG: aminoacyl-histidine dipeptidase [Spirochaetota bacterium]